jgi:DUF1365 family protein
VTADGSAFYVGEVRHARTRPKVHRLRYRVFMMLFDLDAIDAELAALRLFSRGRFNLMSFHPRDHGDGSATPLKAQVETLLDQAGLAPDGGPIRLLCMPRVLGFVFNPLSVYFCWRRSGELSAIVYEVSSTFGQRHSYVMPATADDRGLVRQTCGKRLHVSPFMDMDLTYRFRVKPPEDAVAVVIDTRDRQGTLLNAVFAGTRRPLTDGAVLRLAAAVPLLTLKVVAAIHGEALKMALKGLRLKPAPTAAPTRASFPGLADGSEAAHVER